MMLSIFSRRSGFTLSELILVVVLISLLAALLMPSLGALKEKSLAAACASNLRGLAAGMQAYAADHNLEFPLDRKNGATGLSWYAPLKNYVPHSGFGKKKGAYFCPANPYKVTASGNGGWTTYAVNSNFVTTDTKESSGDPDFIEKRAVMRWNQVDGVKALLLDAYNGPESGGTWYKISGARHSNPWTNTWAVHGDRVNVVFTDGHIEAPRVSPRTIRQPSKDLNELRAEWFWPLQP